MKKIVLFLFLFCALKSSAQIGVKLIQFRPVGEFGMVMSKSISGELMYQEEFDNKVRERFGIG